MFKTLLMTSFSALLISSSAQANPLDDLMGGSSVIYGKDNRMEVNQASSRIQQLAKSVAIQVPTRRIKRLEEDRNVILSQTLGEGFNLCPKERFFKQPAPGSCTGFLVAPDVLVTAGRLVKQQEIVVINLGYLITPLTIKSLVIMKFTNAPPSSRK